jgi:hypothetical protein
VQRPKAILLLSPDWLKMQRVMRVKRGASRARRSVKI